MRQIQQEEDEEFELWKIRLQVELRHLKPLDRSYWASTYNPGASGSYTPRYIIEARKKAE